MSAMPETGTVAMIGSPSGADFDLIPLSIMSANLFVQKYGFKRADGRKFTLIYYEVCGFSPIQVQALVGINFSI